MTERRVVVTGFGAISPLGIGVDTLWESLLAGKSGIRPISAFNTDQFDSKIGGECPEFKASDYIDVRKAKRMDRFAQFAYVVGKMAYDSAGLSEGNFNPARAGVIIGSGIGGLKEIEEQHKRLIDKGPKKVSPFTIPKLMANAGAGHVSIELNFQGINTTVVTACASAGSAMGDAFTAIRYGMVDMVMTGGSEAAVTPLGLSAFASMKALSTRNDDPEHASRPFDKDRDGFVLAEGAGLLLFEEYEHAKARGANIIAEIIGFGGSGDAGDMVQPDPEGRGAARAMTAALKDAKLNPEDINYINAHGTSTPLGDIAETKAIKNVFGSAAKSVMVSSTKSATGHLLGASGGVEAIASIHAIANNVVPPTINFNEGDAECDLDYVPNTARDANVQIAMSNSFGFGGHNASIIFKKI